jgi:acyl carrier protein
MMGPRPEQQIQDDLVRVLGAMGSGDYSRPIGPETRLFADLGLASIDAVVLGESLQKFYGRSLPFGDLMAELGRRDDRDLKVGELVGFLRRHL